MRRASLIACSIAVCATASAFASDHGDAPLVSANQATDIGDIYFFLDPTDNGFAVLTLTGRGFIVPGEARNFGVFPTDQRYRFAIERTGDAVEDLNIDVVFGPRTSGSSPQTATINLRNASGVTATFTAPTTVPSNTSAVPPPFVVTTDPGTNISFFAGMTDDPFFFDIPATSLFIASVLGGTPDPTVFDRGRDTFAGYNIVAIALRVPVATLVGTGGSVVGFAGYTELAQRTKRSRNLGFRDKGGFVGFDRAGIPAVNVLLVPFARKDEFNRANTADDAAGVFAADIVATLTALGTDAAHIATLADLAVNDGDFLRLDTAVPNTGMNVEAAFPNGRRLQDDVVDTLLTVVANDTDLGDNADANDKTFEAAFPFLALPHQPQAAGTLDDGTRN